ncbi:hypothetical protein [Cyclobacterium plantarum]|uniref:Uncharacterized protein n=1 Tax=Cyclobacterium plantarum TaxID=2716263 RepID=A0ABX0H7R0_9BACT|nr:hypothetical protein [Cyclobacterium plantarum]NHE56389.1 hypothetical protein [Cyclobacterium plantarum]
MNMTLDELIIELIIQDLKHNQLILGLDRLNLDAGYCHYLGIMDLIQRLMGVADDAMDEFSATYMAAMHRSLEFPISRSEEELKPLAIECYKNLKEKLRG